MKIRAEKDPVNAVLDMSPLTPDGTVPFIVWFQRAADPIGLTHSRVDADSLLTGLTDPECAAARYLQARNAGKG